MQCHETLSFSPLSLPRKVTHAPPRFQDLSGPISAEDALAVDAQCRAFVPVIRAAGAGTLDGEWATPDGRFAQMLLCDQLTRGAFRGSPEAFAFDARAMEICRGLYQDESYTEYTVHDDAVPALGSPCRPRDWCQDHWVRQEEARGGLSAGELCGQGLRRAQGGC